MTATPIEKPGAARRFLSAATPLCASILLHAIVLLACAGAVWTIRYAAKPPEEPGELVLTLPGPAAPSEADPPAPRDTPAPDGLPSSRPPVAAAPGPVPPAGLTATPAPSLTSTAPPVAAAFSASKGVERTPAFGASFAGAKVRRASRVVYVVDASGAMVSSLSFVVAEAARSIGALDESQRFQVVLLREAVPGAGGDAFEVFNPDRAARIGLLRATADKKRAAADWLSSIRPSGRSDPLPGVLRALEFKPDAVFLLSRSIRRSEGRDDTVPLSVWGRPRDEILAALDRLNPVGASGRRRVVIKTIQFVEDDPSGIMQAIAEAHGDGPGSYSVLTLDKLRPP